MMEFQNILLIRTDRIGDVVLTSPLITILHREFPRSKIFFLTRDYTAPLLKHYEFLEEIIIYRPETEHRGFSGHLKLAKILKEKKIDIAFLFYPLSALALALFMAEIPFRVGTGYRWFSFFLNYRIYEHRAGRHPLYAWLTDPANGHPGDIQWNFEKFLIGRDGKLLKRYAPTTKPRDKDLMQDIANAL